MFKSKVILKVKVFSRYLQQILKLTKISKVKILLPSLPLFRDHKMILHLKKNKLEKLLLLDNLRKGQRIIISLYTHTKKLISVTNHTVPQGSMRSSKSYLIIQ